VTDIILHHYQLSPYSEKVRLALGLKKLSWRSVDIPIWTPRPNLTPMTGGYRRVPVMQLGADIYCDTLLILRVIERLHPTPSIYPSGQEGIVKAICWWIEKSSFMNAVCLTVSAMGGKLPQALIDERRPFFELSLEPADLLPERGVYLQRLGAHVHWLSEMLRDGRKFLIDDSPSAADLSAYHPIWFARQNGGPQIEALLPMAGIGPWYDRVAAIGHGNPTSLTPEEAVDIARQAQPAKATEWTADAEGVGLRSGDVVTVTADDYGRNPISGSLMSWTSDEVVIGHEDASVGRVNLHFPRAGFDVRKVKMAA
jgi:glutathione S-transferase